MVARRSVEDLLRAQGNAGLSSGPAPMSAPSSDLVVATHIDRYHAS